MFFIGLKYCRISEKELVRTFNCGVGMILVVPEKLKKLLIILRKTDRILNIGKKVTANESRV